MNSISRDTLLSVNMLWGKEFGVICLRQTGLDHTKKSLPCDDFGMVLLDPETDIRLMVLSDGMGSYPDSRFSARSHCTSAALNSVTETLFDASRKRGFYQSRLQTIAYDAALENRAYCNNYFGVEPTEMAATLQLAIGSGNYTDILNIGDGGGYVSHPLTFITPVTEKVSGKTSAGFAILDPDEWGNPNRVQKYSAEGSTLVIATDGHADRFVELSKQGHYVEYAADWILEKSTRLTNDSFLTVLPNAYAILCGMSAISRNGKIVVGKNHVPCDDSTVICSKRLEKSEVNEPLAAFLYESNNTFSMCSMTSKQSNSFARGIIIEDDSYTSLMLHVTLIMKNSVLNPGLLGQIKSYFFLNVLEQHLVRKAQFEDGLSACVANIRAALRGSASEVDAVAVVVSCKSGATYFATFQDGDTSRIRIRSAHSAVTALNCWNKSDSSDVVITTNDVLLDSPTLKSCLNHVHHIVHGKTVDTCELPGVKFALSLRDRIGSGSVTFLRNMWRVEATKVNAAVVPSDKHESNQGASDSKKAVVSLPPLVANTEVVSQKPQGSTKAERDAERARLRNYADFPERKILDEAYGVPDDEDTCTVDGIGVVMWQDAKLGRIESIWDEAALKYVDTVYLPDGKCFKLKLVSESWRLHLWKAAN
jgi:hypothetical protein